MDAVERNRQNLREPSIGVALRRPRVVTDADLASAFGHAGIDVVATTRLILWIEQVAHEALGPFFGPGEGSVGSAVDVEHLAPAVPGMEVEIAVRVSAVDGHRVTFAVVATSGDEVLMRGTHRRGVVDLGRFRTDSVGPAVSR